MAKYTACMPEAIRYTSASNAIEPRWRTPAGIAAEAGHADAEEHPHSGDRTMPIDDADRRTSR